MTMMITMMTVEMTAQEAGGAPAYHLARLPNRRNPRNRKSTSSPQHHGPEAEVIARPNKMN